MKNSEALSSFYKDSDSYWYYLLPFYEEEVIMTSPAFLPGEIQINNFSIADYPKMAKKKKMSGRREEKKKDREEWSWYRKQIRDLKESEKTKKKYLLRKKEEELKESELEEELSKTKIIVPHKGEEINFQYPSIKKGTYSLVNSSCDPSNLSMPTSAETASLFYAALQKKYEKHEAHILDLLKKYPFCEATANLILPKSNDEIDNGIILETNPSIVNGKLSMDKTSLVKRLQNNDPLVKFVPFGFKLWKQTWQELEKNEYILARYGEEGAEKLAKLASEYKMDPQILIRSPSRESVGGSTLKILGKGNLSINSYGFAGENKSGYCTLGIKEIPSPNNEN